MADSVDSKGLRRSTIGRELPGIALAFTLLVAFVWSDPLFTHRSFAGRDLVPYNLPMEKAIHDAYARGHLPIWVSEISGGRPILPNPNAGALYPLRALLSPLPFPLAAKLFPILHWTLAGLGVFVLSRTLGVSAAGAWIAAVSYAFSGVAVSEVYFPHVLPGMALIPWIGWGLARPGRFAAKGILLSLLFALLMLAGDVFTFGMAILAGAGWIAFGARSEERQRLVLLLCAAVGLAVLAGLPQVVATALWVPETDRAVRGVQLGEALLFAVSPWRLLELVVPYPFGQHWAADPAMGWHSGIFGMKAMGLFMTLFVGSLGVIGLVATWRDRQPLARFGRFLFLSSVALSTVWSLVPAAWRERRAPVALRNPEKFAVLSSLGLALLAGLAVADLCARPRLPRWILGAAIALFALALCAEAWPAIAGRTFVTLIGSEPDQATGAARALPLALVEGALLWAVTLLALVAMRRSPAGLAAGLALLTAVPIVVTRPIGWTFNEDDVFAPTPGARSMARQDPRNEYRTLGEFDYSELGPLVEIEAGNDLGALALVRRSFNSHAGVLFGRGTVFNGDFDRGDFSRVQSARDLSYMPERFRDGGARFFGSLALRFGLRYRDQRPVAGFSPVRHLGYDSWDENRDALPDVRLVTGWKEEPDALSALRDLADLESGAVVVESGRASAGSSPGGGVRILEKTPERLVLETDAAAPTWLFVLRGYWPYRDVRVDGRDVEASPAQLAFSAIPVEAGRHRVEWEERIPGWGVSRFGPPLFLVALAAWGARSAREARSIEADRRPAT